MRSSVLSLILALLTAVLPRQGWSGMKGPLDLERWTEQDVHQVLRRARNPIRLSIAWNDSATAEFKIDCAGTGQFLIAASGSTPSERREQVYAALFEMGFLFPHPRIQIDPTPARLSNSCGRSGSFHARVLKRGFHLHTMHPSEWVNGFLMDDLSIADDTIRWLVRNQQNVLQVQTLRSADMKHMGKALELAHDAGLEVGFSAAFALQQQKAMYLVPFLSTFGGGSWRKPLREKLDWILRSFNFDFVGAEMGTTEFTSTPVEQTLEWMEETRRILSEGGKKLFIKIHTSTGQVDPQYGNYNFIAKYSNPEVGVLPHTVMFYGLGDHQVPMYGRKNFDDVRAFMLEENQRRPTWYYPETSYYVGMDIDIPLFLTDYLLTRRADFDEIVGNQIQGHLTFSTGQELGYWLFDWNVALQAWPQSEHDPWLALRLLGEDVHVWQSICEYQRVYFNEKQLIRMLSSSNLMDELPGFHPIHERSLLRDLHRDRSRLASEIRLLEEALSAYPSIEGVKDFELRSMLQVTGLRVRHAHAIRKIIEGREKSHWIAQAAQYRADASKILEQVHATRNRYPASIVFQRKSNVTSYDEGYGLTAIRLHFWEREERMAASFLRSKDPFFMNLYNIWKLLF